MASPAATIRCISGHWHVVVTVNGSEQTYPAPTKLEAEIMMVRERRRLNARAAAAVPGAGANKDAAKTGDEAGSSPYDVFRH